MAGSQYTKISRSTSSSPRLKCSFASRNKHKDSGQQKIQTENIHRSKSCSPQKCSSPLQHGKGRHPPMVSPPYRSESTSPNAKTISIASKSTAVCDQIDESLLLEIKEALEESLAVPKVTAMPPKPTLLPRPPLHWFGELGTHCLASKQQCKVDTQCLMSHLSSSGILILAQ